MINRSRRNKTSVVGTIIVVSVSLLVKLLKLLFIQEQRFAVNSSFDKYTIRLLSLFIRNVITVVVAHPGGIISIGPSTFQRCCCSSSTGSSSSMTCRPTLPTTTTTTTTASPITTTYRKRLLVAFAQSQSLKVDNDVIEHTIDSDTIDNEDSKTWNDNINPDEEYQFLKQVSTLSSSPPRTCSASAMTQCCTIQQIYELRNQYDTAAKQLHTIMSDPNLNGNIKHQKHCQHRYKYGRQPLVCKDCWSYLPICICHKQQPQQHPNVSIPDENLPSGDSIFLKVPRLQLPPLIEPNIRNSINSFDMIDVIMWTHHKEWGSPSNTGSVMVVALKQLGARNHSHSDNFIATVRGYMLMKGYDEHDDQLEQLLHPSNDTEIVIPVVLWAPATATSSSPVFDNIDKGEEIEINGDHSNIESNQRDHAVNAATAKRQFVSVDELLDDLHQIRTGFTNLLDNESTLSVQTSQRQKIIRLVMIAVEGTWNQAKRMVTKLPHHVRALHLSDIELFHWRTKLLSLSREAAIDRDTNEEVLTREKQLRNNDNKEPIQIRGAVSLLDPLRKQKTLNRYPSKKEKQHHQGIVYDNENNNDTEAIGASKLINTNKVCTVEAAVSALVAIDAIPIPDGDYIINLADQKVIRTVTFQGKMTLRNIISHW